MNHDSPPLDRDGGRPIRGTLAILLAGMVGVSATGCTTSTLSAGGSLAAAGQKASSQMEQQIALSGETLQQAQTALAFTDGYNGVPDASKALQSQISALQTNLAVYAKLLNSLGASYAALGAISGYGGSADFNGAVHDLSANVNAFAKAVGAPSPLSAEATAAIGAAGGQIIGAVQAHEVKTASREIDVHLQAILRILSTDGVRDKVVPARGLIEGDINAAALVLYASGAASSQTLVDSIGAPLGLKAASGVDAVVAKSSKLQAGLSNAELSLAAQRVTAIGASYDSSLRVLKGLEAAHQSIARGEAIDVSTISVLLVQLQATTSALRADPGASGKGG